MKLIVVATLATLALLTLINVKMLPVLLFVAFLVAINHAFINRDKLFEQDDNERFTDN